MPVPTTPIGRVLVTGGASGLGAAVVDAVLEEDAQGVAVSSYQGGHVEYFEYLVSSLAERGAPDVKVYGGGGGVIVRDEIERLARSGVTIFSPEDGQRLGLAGMVNRIVAECDVPGAYLHSILADLRRHRLLAVAPKRQPGGYRLLRSPDAITVAEVLRALSGPFVDVAAVTMPSTAVSPASTGACGARHLCIIGITPS